MNGLQLLGFLFGTFLITVGWEMIGRGLAWFLKVPRFEIGGEK